MRRKVKDFNPFAYKICVCFLCIITSNYVKVFEFPLAFILERVSGLLKTIPSFAKGVFLSSKKLYNGMEIP